MVYQSEAVWHTFINEYIEYLHRSMHAYIHKCIQTCTDIQIQREIHMWMYYKGWPCLIAIGIIFTEYVMF